MPVLLPTLPEPTDLVLKGEQLRASVLDALSALVGNVMGGSVVTGFASLVPDEDVYLPMNPFVEGNLLSMRRARNGDLQRRANAGIATPCGAWIPNDWTPLLNPLTWGTERWAIGGVTRDGTGSPLAACAVVARDAGRLTPDTVEAEAGATISDGSGAYSIEVPLNTAYQLTAYKPGATDVAGITRIDVTPTAVG